MTQIAGDGGLLERPVGRRRIPLHPAERVDLVIDFRDYGPGTELVLHNDDGEGGTVAVMRFDVARGGGREDFRVPRRLRALERLPRAAARPALGAGARRCGAWQINGREFDHARVDVRPRHGSTERWTFVNRSNRVHPMHIHGFLFRVLERSSGRVHPADRLGWKDTVGVLPNETVTVLAWFAPYSGRYVFHCHALEHADQAMMLQLEVVRMRWVRRPSSRRSRFAPQRRPRRAPTVQAVDAATSTMQPPLAARSTIKARRHGHVALRRHDARAQREVDEHELDRRLGELDGRPDAGRLHGSHRRARYTFVCKFHGHTMTGTSGRDVSGSPPPPPPPAAERAAVGQRPAAADACSRSPTRCGRG